MDIHESTRSYEAWLRAQIPIVRPDLEVKHRRMRESPFVFLRGTFYRWMELWPSVCATVADAPAILAVGDLHVENFGTWRDKEGRLIWGVNDVDEATSLPYTQDLVRLAASATLAVEARHFALTIREACEAIAEGYRRGIENGGSPFVLERRRPWLRQLALGELRDPVRFWKRLWSLPPARTGAPHDALCSLWPDAQLQYRVVRRVAGVGSLGRPRFVALADWCGGPIAREAKALVPSAAEWIRGEKRGVSRSAEILRIAVRAPDPFFLVGERWIVRRLSPECSRIELVDLEKGRDEWKLLRAMGRETSNMHLGSGQADVAADLRRRKGRWLERAAVGMARAIERDWREWIRGPKASRTDTSHDSRASASAAP
jgi:hypothetical protein